MAEGAAGSPLAEVLRDAWTVACHRPRFLAAAILIPTLAYALVDWQLQPDDALPAWGLFALVMLYLQLLVTYAALDRFGLLPERHDPRRPTLGRYPAALGLSVLYLVAVLAGLIALIVPGLVLIVRWTVSIPVLLGEGESIVGSLKRSWSLTRGNGALVVGVYILLILWSVPPILLTELWYPEYAPVPLAAALPTNLLLTLGQVAWWLVSAALYRRLREQERAANPGGHS